MAGGNSKQRANRNRAASQQLDTDNLDDDESVFVLNMLQSLNDTQIATKLKSG